MSIKSIIIKIVTAAAFICGIGGGMYLVGGALSDRDWMLFLRGAALLVGGTMAVGALVPWIAYFDGQADWEEDGGRATITGSATVGLMAMYFMANALFVLASTFLAVEDGMWGLFAGAIASFIIMIVVFAQFSISWQISKSTKVKHYRNAVKTSGVVTSVHYKFPIWVFGRTICFITELVVEVNGVKSTALLRKRSKLGKRVGQNSAVTVLFDAKRPRYCLLQSVDGVAAASGDGSQTEVEENPFVTYDK